MTMTRPRGPLEQDTLLVNRAREVANALTAAELNVSGALLAYFEERIDALELTRRTLEAVERVTRNAEGSRFIEAMRGIDTLREVPKHIDVRA